MGPPMDEAGPARALHLGGGGLGHTGGMTTASPAPTRPDGSHLDRVPLFGLEFVDAPDIGAVVEAVLAFDEVPEGRLPLVVTPNLDHLVQLRDADARVADATRRAAFVLPDGQPIVWASGWLGRRLRARLTGADLFASLWDRLADAGLDAHVVCPTAEVAEGLRARHRSASTTVAPVFDSGDASARAAVVAAVVEAIGDRRPAHVFVCLGQPKQLLVSLDLLDAWPDRARPPLYHCVGAAPEMYLGLTRRAPTWLRRSGLEFAYRLAQEPRRLLGRYARDALAFPGLVLAERRRRRR